MALNFTNVALSILVLFVLIASFPAINELYSELNQQLLTRGCECGGVLQFAKSLLAGKLSPALSHQRRYPVSDWVMHISHPAPTHWMDRWITLLVSINNPLFGIWSLIPECTCK